MSTIKQKGVPTIKTKGAVGDTYIDLNTGNKYKCVFAYGIGANLECQWKLTSEKKPFINKPVEKQAVKKHEEIKQKPQVEVVEPVKVEEKEPVVTEPVETTEAVEEKSKRTDYTSYSKKK